DYWSEVDMVRHAQMRDFEAGVPAERIFCFSAHATRLYTQVRYQAGDAFVFGSESRGLPPEVLARHAERTLTIPMRTGKVRSLNLAGAVSVVVYEALRQVCSW